MDIAPYKLSLNTGRLPTMIKKLIATTGIFLSFLLIAAFAQAYTIPDNYWGGTITSGGYANRDVVGDSWRFGIEYIDVSNGGGSLTIKVHGDYFGTYFADRTNNTNNVYNMRPGDLFISTTGWNMPGQVAPYPNDTYSSGQQWNYAFDFGDNFNLGTSGTVNLYAIANGTITNTNITNIIPPGTYTYRADQEWAFTPFGSVGPVGSGSWEIVNNDLIITYIGTIPGDWMSWGFHWTMQCGNDSIEGGTPVPEPGILILLGIGLSSVGLLARRFKF
jgi:hypothetical protein